MLGGDVVPASGADVEVDSGATKEALDADPLVPDAVVVETPPFVDAGFTPNAKQPTRPVAAIAIAIRCDAIDRVRP